MHITTYYLNDFAANRRNIHSLSNIYHNDNEGSSVSEKPHQNQGTNNKSDRKRIEFKDNDIDIDEKIHHENPYGDFYINEEIIPDIAVRDFRNVIEEKSKNKDDGFKKEYAVGKIEDAYVKPFSLHSNLLR